MATASSRWPGSLPVAQVRIARPTDQLEKVVAFYSKGLGLTILTSFQDHAGYDGVVIGLPGREYHLEFSSHPSGSPGPAPSRDNLLVLYVPDIDQIDKMVARLDSLGHSPVSAENPYWEAIGATTFEDPDG